MNAASERNLLHISRAYLQCERCGAGLYTVLCTFRAAVVNLLGIAHLLLQPRRRAAIAVKG